MRTGTQAMLLVVLSQSSHARCPGTQMPGRDRARTQMPGHSGTRESESPECRLRVPMRCLHGHPGVDSRTGERAAAGGHAAIAVTHAPPPPRLGRGVAAGRRICTPPLHRAQRVTARKGDGQTGVGATGGQVSDRRVAVELRVGGTPATHSRAQERRGREGGNARAREGGKRVSSAAPRLEGRESPPATRWWRRAGEVGRGDGD